jgi:hypothetical protein
MIYINAESANPELAREQLEALGLDIVTTRLAEPWEGRPPESLIIARTPDFSTALARGLLKFTRDHKQECVAVRFSHNIGMLIGVTEHRYDEDFFATT